MSRSRKPHHPTSLPTSWALTIAALALAFLPGLSVPLLAQDAQITGISATEATVGTTFEITGTGFGTKAPKVFLVEDGLRVKGTKLKASQPTGGGTSVMVEVKKAVYGTFNVMLDPRGKANAPATSEDFLDIVLPEIIAVDVDMTVMGGDVSAVEVDDVGEKGIRVFVGGYKAKILSVQPTPVEGIDNGKVISFRIPKKIPNGLWDVEVTNKVGGDLLPGALRVIGSNKNIKKPMIEVEAPGGRDFKAKKKVIDVTSSFSGPTTVRGMAGKKSSRSIDLVLPFSLGSEQAPATFTDDPAMVRLIDQDGREWISVPDSFELNVGVTDGDFVAGSFSADLFPVEEGAEVLPVYGRFIYDGQYQLPDGGGDTPRDLDKGEEAPGLVIQVLELSGAKGGNFQPGNTITMTFRIAKSDGTSWHLDEMDSTRAIVSGPTFNYQRVIAQVSDIRTVATDNGDGTYTYKFPVPIPDTYLPPLNDSPSFDEDDGELTGQPLLDGTYTLGLYFYWQYNAGDDSFREVGTTTVDFLVGDSVTETTPREVVTAENCNECHSQMQFHGGTRTGVTICLMCHTAGSEDRNIPSVAGGTPGTTVEFSVMIHKLHNGAHLPSVNGVKVTDMSGEKDYTVDPEPYQIVGYGNSIHDYSDVVFPAWPNFAANMPKDLGHSDLGPFTSQENAILGGITSCNLCHGDPDGMGPLEVPEQGENAYTQLRRNTCGSCHDDWDPTLPYVANTNGMPALFNDATCAQCHPRDGGALAVVDAHLHPLLNPDIVEGVNLDLLSVAESEVMAPDGTLDPGEKLAITFTLSDDMGMSVDPASLTGISAIVTGPTNNANLVLPESDIPAEILTGPQPYTINLPMRVYYEILGDATGGDDTFTTDWSPIWDLDGETDVFEQTDFGDGATVLAAAVNTPVNYIDVINSTGFARNEYVLIDAGEMGQEYLQIQTVEGNRLWFSSPYTQSYAPGPLFDHTVGATVDEVILTELTEGMDYDVTLPDMIEEIDGAFGTGNPIVVSYTSDFVMPETYPLPLNAGPDLTEQDGSWAGKSLVDGTYTVTIWGERTLVYMEHGESNTYREPARGVIQDFLVGDATTIDPYSTISDIANCEDCHVDIQFHGSHRAGLKSCFACHGTAGAGDRPQYVAPNAPATDGTTINFREMVHKIHRGADLAKADEYVVNGFGSPGNFPNNFTPHMYDHVTFPSFPEGTQDCARCHGVGNDSFEMPQNRQHPTEQGLPTQSWTIACGSCHDADAEHAHMQAQSSPINGAESCSICHGPGQTWDVQGMHQVR